MNNIVCLSLQKTHCYYLATHCFAVQDCIPEWGEGTAQTLECFEFDCVQHDKYTRRCSETAISGDQPQVCDGGGTTCHAGHCSRKLILKYIDLAAY